MNKIHNAWKLAKEVHKNQKRFNGQPYINHIKDIDKILDECGLWNEKTLLYSILHDTMEDSKDPNIINKLIKIDRNLPLRIGVLTHSKNETYEQYIDGIIACSDRNIVIVKIADMIQNLTEDPKKKQREKYRKALPKLIKAFIGGLLPFNK